MDEGSPYTLTLGEITDLGDDTLAQYVVDWGDGPPETVAGDPASVTHTYADGPAVYAIAATVVDEDGTHAGAGSLGLTVNNVAPTVTAGVDEEAELGKPVSVSATFTDPGTADTHAATIDWGDGATSVGTVAEPGEGIPGTVTDPAGHAYTEIGKRTVMVTVTDDDGGSASDTLVIEVFCADPAGDVNAGPASGDADLVRCGASNDAQTLSIMLQVAGLISDNVQYRVYLNDAIRLMYNKFRANGPRSLEAVHSGDTLTFTVDLVEVGLASGDRVQLYFETQAGVKGSKGEGKPDRMPDSGTVEYVVK